MYQLLIENFKHNPHDVHTVPFTKRNYTWFYVFVENDKLYIEPAHNHAPKSAVKRRPLHNSECNEMLSIYHRRLRGEQISAEARTRTYSQVYWYGIFAELNL